MSYLTHPDAFVYLVRESVGLFFYCTGFRKLFDPQTHAKIKGLFTKLGVGNKFVEWAVPAGEFLGGLALTIGFLTPIAAIGLLIILAGAIYLDCWAELRGKHPQDSFDWIAKTLYTPEILMSILLIGLTFVGDDQLSWDVMLRKWL